MFILLRTCIISDLWRGYIGDEDEADIGRSYRSGTAGFESEVTLGGWGEEKRVELSKRAI